MGVSEDIKLVGLSWRDVHDPDFVCVDDRGAIEVSEEGRKCRFIDDSTMSRGVGIGRQLEWEEGRVDADLLSTLRWSSLTPYVTCDGVGNWDGRCLAGYRDHLSNFLSES